MAEHSARGARRIRAFAIGILLVAQAVVLVDVASREAEAAFDGQFVWPMDGRVTSEYWECRSDCSRYHRGIDIANGCDTPIHAARAGVASVHSDPGGYGNYVKVDHDHGFETLYAHMASVSVSNGQSVTTSTRLGYEGSTGASTGCHVHFEIRQDDAGPAVEIKQFLPSRIDDAIVRGAAVPLEMRLLEATVTASVLDGPNVQDVSGQGSVAFGTAQPGERYVAYSSWTNDAGESWYAVSFNGRIGWIRSDRVDEAGGDAERVTADGALNVRAGAGTSYADVGDVFGGQEYFVLDSVTSGGATWHKIHYDGTDGAGVGWFHGGYSTRVTYDAPEPPAPGDLTGKKIVVDPGHGGSDPGASGFDLVEKDVNLDIGLRLRDLLEADGATVLMTRTTDATVSLADRVALANDNGADRFVSVHANSCGSCGGHGTETYYHSSLSSTSAAADLATKAQTEVVDHLGTRDRGVKQADFHVLRETAMPAVLVETAFIDHADDNALLADADSRQEFARAMLHGIQSHFGLTPHDPGTGGTPQPGFVDDFEGADPGWTTEDAGGPAAWARTTARASSPTRSMALAAYGASENDRLVTPDIELAGTDSPVLELRSWMQGERSCWLFGCTVYDYGKIEVTSDGGASWRTLKDQYWSSGGAWETLSLDLAAEAGDTIRLRFTFVSDGSTQNEGWYLDDVEVRDDGGGGGGGSPTAGFVDDFEGADPGWTTEDAGGAAAWARTTARAASPTHSMALAGYGGGENDRLVTPAISLEGLSSPTLELASWMDGERSCWFLGCTIHDYGKIEVTSDGGASWRTLKDQYWSSGGAWETLSLDLSDEAGATVQIRFTFVSDGSVSGDGWFVDDVRVE